MKFLFYLSISICSIIVTKTIDIASISSDPIKVTDGLVDYKVSDDKEYIYVNVSTKDQKTSLSILRHGLSVYFDVKGNEDKNVYVKYPYDSAPVQMPRKPRNESTEEEKPKIDFNAIIAELPGEAEYVYYDDRQQFHKDLNALEITMGYTVTDDLFEYELKIPESKISNDSKADFSELTVGVVTNTFDKKPEKDSNEASQGGRGSGGRGGRGGGGGGGRGGRGGRGQGGGRGGERSPSQEQAVSIDFWFAAPLSN
ncbi:MULTISPECIES: hypothetical protein [Nonlabens]|uniref:hypothetical protein n=1 Tax=Nonlabens TaxID=363408 RepID=UPI003262F089